MSVHESWSRIMAWAQANSPRSAQTVAASAGADSIAATAARFSYPWPQDLRDWYALQNGCVGTPSFEAVPACDVLSLTEVIEHAQVSRDIMGWDDERDVEYGQAEADALPAGTSVGFYLPSYVPICDYLSGWQLYVDTRRGPLSGCVRMFEPVETDDDEDPLWQSVDAMLAEVADALEQGLPVDDYVPTVDAGYLRWTPP